MVVDRRIVRFADRFAHICSDEVKQSAEISHSNSKFYFRSSLGLPDLAILTQACLGSTYRYEPCLITFTISRDGLARVKETQQKSRLRPQLTKPT